MLNKKRFQSSGFTLIELLIVIVIIGILAGVVIGVLNPVQQQNRARDASFRSSLNKMALSGKSLYVSSPRSANRAPTALEFAAGVGNYLAPFSGANCGDSTVANHGLPTATVTCFFQVDGLTTPENCQTAYNGEGTTACNFVYYRTPALFRIGIRGAAAPAQLFVFSYEEVTTSGGTIAESFYTCPVGQDITVATSVLNTNCTQLN